MTRLASGVAVVLLGLCLAQCGSEVKTNGREHGTPSVDTLVRGTARGPIPFGRYVRGDYDDDDNGGPDADDVEIRAYGHRAKAGEARAAERVVKRYYAAVARDDGTAACRLMDRRLSESRDYAKTVPPAYVPAAGSSLLQGKDCGQVASLLFEPSQQQFATDARSVKLAELRRRKNEALAILLYTTDPEGQISLRRERGTWRIDAILPAHIE